MSRPRRTIGWWLPAAAVAVGVLLLGWTWLLLDAHRQTRVQWTMGVVVSVGLLVVSWAVLMSPLRRRTRLTLGLVALGCAALFVVAFRLRGVTGDVVPIFEFRFGARREPASVSSEAVEARRVHDGEAPRPAREYPEFLGPGRLHTIGGVPLARDWEARPPRLLWRQPIGRAWSGFAVAGDAAFTQEQRGEEEAVTCYGLLEGELRWMHTDRARYDTVLAGVGPRATPTVAGERIYTMGATGLLNCLDRETGRRVWVRDVLRDNGGKAPEWGMSGSPLVSGDLVIACAGGPGRSMVAYGRETGEPAWGAGTDAPGYSSPQPAVLAGAKQVLILNDGSVAAHDPADGEVLWQAPWQREHPNVAQPLPLPGDRVLVSTGYGVGCALFRISRDQAGSLRAEEVWGARSLKAKFANFVHRDGFVYGLDDGILVSIDVETGKRRWKAGRYGHGQMILVDDLILVTAESGDVALVEATPEEHRELTRFPAVEGKTWNTPAFAAPYLLVRNDEEAGCYELPLEAPAR